ncbi:MAG: hypothetical protein LVQ95_01825 [Candidatus Micrarchaeales archaeon]|nr:hypothetical protein [Candidatus Micrarchaeales archaeon]
MPKTKAPGMREPLGENPGKFLSQYSGSVEELLLAFEEVLQEVGRRQAGKRDADEFDRNAGNAILKLLTSGKLSKRLRERLNARMENGSVYFELGGITFTASSTYNFINPKTAKPTITGLLREFGFDPQEYSDLNPWMISDLLRNSPDPNAAKLRKQITERNLMKPSVRIQIRGAVDKISQEREPWQPNEKEENSSPFVPASELIKGKKYR